MFATRDWPGGSLGVGKGGGVLLIEDGGDYRMEPLGSPALRMSVGCVSAALCPGLCGMRC